MNLTTETVAKSLAAYLSPLFPDVTMYENPNQQGTHVPCMFLQQRSSTIKLQTGGYWLRTLKLDLTYLIGFNLPDMQQRYTKAAEVLDLAMETFPYTDGSGETATPLRAFDREASIDLDALHYKFELRARVSVPAEYEKMQELELNERIVDNGS